MKPVILSVLLLVLLGMSSCAKEEIEVPNQDNRQAAVAPPAADTCCALKYPAVQAEVAGTDVLLKQFLISSFQTPTGLKYQLTFTPSANYINVSQAYINYVKALHPCTATAHSGTLFHLSQGTLGGHTVRRVVEPRYVEFNGTTWGVNTNAPFWTSYYENPTALPPSPPVPYSTTLGLSPNEVYGLEYGFWISGCTLTSDEEGCLGYFNYVTFKLGVSAKTSARSGKPMVDIDILDGDGQVLRSFEKEVE